MKSFLFIFMAGATAIFFSYVAGMRLGRERCRADVVGKSGESQLETIKIMENVNAKSFNTSLGDIRRVLREEYTIAE